VSTISHAARDLFGNMPNSAPEPSAWPLQHAELYTLGWIVAIIAVFAPLAIRRYRSAQLSS